MKAKKQHLHSSTFSSIMQTTHPNNDNASNCHFPSFFLLSFAAFVFLLAGVCIRERLKQTPGDKTTPTKEHLVAMEKGEKRPAMDADREDSDEDFDDSDYPMG